MRVIDSYYNDGVKITLTEDNGSYTLIRKDGKYSYVEKLGKISRDQAQAAFGRMTM